MSGKKRGPYLTHLTSNKKISKNTLKRWKRQKPLLQQHRENNENVDKISNHSSNEAPESLCFSDADEVFHNISKDNSYDMLPMDSFSKDDQDNDLDDEDFSIQDIYSSGKQCMEGDPDDNIDCALIEDMSYIVNSEDDSDDVKNDEDLSENSDDEEYVPDICEGVGNSDQPIYEGSSLTLSISLMLIMTFIMRHKITGVAVVDLLSLIEAHMIIPNICRTSMKLIRQFFMKMRTKAVFHYYCSKCQSYIGTDKTGICCKTPCSETDNYFICIPLKTNLTSLFAYKDILCHLKYPTDRKKKHSQNIEDVIDGRSYKSLFNCDGYLHGTTEAQKNREIHISLQLNTDGVRLFKSSKIEIWPIYYTINELCPSLRYQRKYRLFAGLWFGKKKPDFKTFLYPFVNELQEFGEKGCYIDSTGGAKLVKCYLLSGIFDAPAKSLFQNMIQFNGKFGCPYCLEPGKTVKTSARGHTHAYPFNFDKMSGYCEARTHNETLKNASDAQAATLQSGKNVTIFGIKGLSWICRIPKFDIVNGVGIDYLHNTLLGIVKMLMKLWFNKSYKNKPWFIGGKIKEIDVKIKQLKLPNLISRVPRNIEEEFSHWKGSEFRSFLLFYSVPVLQGYLPQEYYQHYLLLADAIFILLKDSITSQDISNSENMLKHFCMKFGRLYEFRYETYNVHNLLHMTQTVKCLGPLWCQSAFWYEDYNGDYKNLFHGTQNVNLQIVSNVIALQKIPEIANVLIPGTSAYSLYNRMTVKSHLSVKGIREEIIIGINVVGACIPVKSSDTVRCVIENRLGMFKESYSFLRICFHGKVIHCMDYKRVMKRNTYTICYNGHFGQSYGFVKHYMKVRFECPNVVHCNEICICRAYQYLAIIESPNILDNTLCSNENTLLKLEHIKTISKDVVIDICFIHDILEICCYVSGTNNDFIVHFPNTWEND